MRGFLTILAKGRLRAAAGLIILELAASPVRAQIAQEYAIKASFIAKFVSFVTWPQTQMGGAGNPATGDLFTVTVFGSNPFRDELGAALRSAGLPGRPIRLRTVSDVKDLGGSKLIYIGGMEKQRVANVVAWAKTNGALTVGDGEGFASQGVIINFYLAESKVRFEINPAAAERSGFQISSLLLKVARIVEDE